MPTLRRPASPSSCAISFRVGKTTWSKLMMIDAVMYGNTPNAKSANRLKAPPTNRSRKLNTLPCCLRMRSNAWTSTPGTGRWVPKRYNTSMIAVRTARRRRSAMRRALSRPPSTGNHLGSSARLLDRRERALAKGMGLNGEGTVECTGPQDFDPTRLDQMRILQLRGRDLAVGGETVEGTQIHRSVLEARHAAGVAHPPGPYPAPKRQALRQDGLTALKSWAWPGPRTRLLPFPSAAAVASASGPQPASHAAPGAASPARWLERVKCQHRWFQRDVPMSSSTGLPRVFATSSGVRSSKSAVRVPRA